MKLYTVIIRKVVSDWECTDVECFVDSVWDNIKDAVQRAHDIEYHPEDFSIIMDWLYDDINAHIEAIVQEIELNAILNKDYTETEINKHHGKRERDCGCN